mmetsp:Transcript_30548/g.46869  ORF Transcript_30548/g.46869 Transcript_30548/m.46869 type:complete len:336 (+) Transcript_30548:76-1083(+)
MVDDFSQNETHLQDLIFSSKSTFKDTEEESSCREMVLSLTEEQQEQAARSSSYAYFKSATFDREEDKPSKDTRKRMALKMARRHLVARNGNTEKAIEMMKGALKMRDQYKVDDIRLCFSNHDALKSAAENTENDIQERLSSIEKLQKIIHDDIMSSQTMCIRGYDKTNQAIILRVPGKTEFFTTEETFLIVQLYWVERALACTEQKSKGRAEKLNMAIDYNGYTRKNKPPVRLIRKFVALLQDFYPERLNLWIAIDPNLVLRTLWSIVSLFLDPETLKKVKFLSGEETKRKELSPCISEDQAVPFLLPEGKLTTPLDMKRHLFDVPFDRAYDEFL